MAEKFPQLDWRKGRANALLFDDGFAAELLETEFFDEPPAGTGGSIKVWTGSAWVEKPGKVWTGSAWVTKPVKVWNGSAWVLA